ncbi:MAG: ABC transporter C-terminal domain-containing protein [Bdellovibrionota bacterium]
MKSIYSKFIFLIFSSISLVPCVFAQTAEYKPYGGEFPIDQLPKGAIIQFNEEIKIDQINASTPGGVVSSGVFVDGKIMGNSDSRTSCKFSVYTAKQDYFGLLVATNGFTIPKDTWASVVMAKQTSDDDASVLFQFAQPIKTTHTNIDFATMDCHLGTGAWWKNSDEKIHVKNARSNLGNRITILQNYIKPQMTKEQQLAAYMNRLKYLLSLLNGGSQSVANSYVGVGYGVGGVGGNQSSIGASSGPGGNSGDSSQGNVQSAIEAEIADLIKKINQFLQDPDLKKSIQEGTKIHEQIEEIDRVIEVSSNLKVRDWKINSSNDENQSEIHLLDDESIKAVSVDKHGNVYVLDKKGKLYVSKNNGASFTEYPIQGPIVVDDVKDIMYVSNGVTFDISETNEKLSIERNLSKRGEGGFYSSIVDANGTFYACNGYLLISKDGGISFKQRDLKHEINTISTDANGTVYVGTEGGLFIFKKGAL